MKITALLPKDIDPTDIDGVITTLKKRSGTGPDMLKVNAALDPTKHSIFDTERFPDRVIYRYDNSGNPKTAAPFANSQPAGLPGAQPSKGLPGLGEFQGISLGKKVFDRYEKINRIALSLQKLIVSRAVSFSVGNPILRTYNGNIDELYKKATAALERVLEDNYEVSLNKQIARALYSAKEVAEYWFCDNADDENEFYGFATSKEIRSVIFSPLEGQKLYPIRNLQGKLVCLSREFSLQYEGETITYFEAVTDEHVVLFKSSSLGIGWEQASDIDLPYGIMPANYVCQPNADYDDVNWIIDRLEFLISKWGDVNNYNMGPTRFINGKITSWDQEKGATNSLVQGDKDTQMQILSWDHAPQSIKDEIETLLKFIFTLTQTPDISFDNLKSIGTISGVALKLLFTDAHLKVEDKADLLLPFFKKRDRIILKILAFINPAGKAGYQKVDPKHALDPYMVADEKEQVEITLAKNGNQPIQSQETSVKDWGGDNAELERIKKEQKDRTMSLITEPTA